MNKRRLSIQGSGVDLEAQLNQTRTASKVWDALPIEAAVSTWGDEIYFRIPVVQEEEEAQSTVQIGDVAFWPPGQALCFFFGPTPVSKDGEIRPASPVNVIGRIVSDPTMLKSLSTGQRIVLEESPNDTQ